MNFRIGQRVVCIYGNGESWPGGYGNEISPKKDEVYTIRATTEIYKRQGVHLCEIKNEPLPYRGGFHECYFDACHFRHIVERETDISIFTEMLNQARERV